MTTPAPATIDERQVTPAAARLLRAYSHEYRKAKRHRGIRLTVGALFAFVGATAGLIDLNVGAFVAAGAGAWAIIGRLALRPAEKRHLDVAVTIQERFDTYVLDLPWSSAAAGTRPSEEDIAAAARRLEDDADLEEASKEGWYPTTSGLPHPVDVIVAQLSAVVWGRRQHRRYSRAVVWLTVSLGVAAVLAGIALQMLLAEWLIVFFLPAMPSLLDVADVSVAHTEMSDRKEAMEARLEELWNQALQDASAVTVVECRSIQDDVFKLRSLGLQIPQWFYRLNRPSDEVTMRDAAAARIDQYRRAQTHGPGEAG